MTWNEEKAARRFALIDKIADPNSPVSEADHEELARLTDELREYVKPFDEGMLQQAQEFRSTRLRRILGTMLDNNISSVVRELNALAGDDQMILILRIALSHHLFLHSMTILESSLGRVDFGDTDARRIFTEQANTQWKEALGKSIWSAIEATDDETVAEGLRKFGAKVCGEDQFGVKDPEQYYDGSEA